MTTRTSLIDHLRSNQPATWSLLKLAATQGLASIDTSTDTLLLDRELEQHHQKLYFVLHRLMSERNIPGTGH